MADYEFGFYWSSSRTLTHAKNLVTNVALDRGPRHGTD